MGIKWILVVVGFYYIILDAPPSKLSELVESMWNFLCFLSFKMVAKIPSIITY